MQYAMPIHAYMWLHAHHHIVDQRVLYLVWPYFNSSRGKRTTYFEVRHLYTTCMRGVVKTKSLDHESFTTNQQNF